MLLETYQKVIKLFQENNGYLKAGQLKNEGITTIQVKELVDKGIVEKISHGHYWLAQENKKPENYKLIEICRVNPKAVICADTALYFHGLIDVEPERISVATLKTDRSMMKVNYPVKRHYYSDLAFEEDIITVDTPYGPIRVYDIERSVCDCIRFRQDVGEKMLELIIDKFQAKSSKQMERLLNYADAMRVGNIVREHLQIEK